MPVGGIKRRARSLDLPLDKPRNPLASNKKRARSFDSVFDKPTKKHRADDTLSSSSTPFTKQFFSDMAITIIRGFPIKEFAQGHDCTTDDVVVALLTTVLRPLKELQQQDTTSSVSEISQIQQLEQLDEKGNGTANSPIVLSDSPYCSSPSSVHKYPVSELSSDLQSISSCPSGVNCESLSETRSRSSTPSKSITGTTTKTSPPQVKGPSNKRPKWPSPIPIDPKAPRTPVRVDIYGSYIPVAKWIDGYHIPAPPKRRSDALSDEEFEKMLADGWFD